jgi:hypothetical protein
MTKPNSAQPDTRVTIDGKFIRDQARDAVHQFFRPITDPFKPDVDKRGTRRGKD